MLFSKSSRIAFSEFGVIATATLRNVMEEGG